MAAARTPRPRRRAATASATGGGGRINGGGLSAARQAELQQRRLVCCEELQRGIRAMEATDSKVRKLMENTEMFVTTTKIGKALRAVLLYPPTECHTSGDSFG